MRRLKILLTLVFFFILLTANVKAQIGIAVAKDENGSSVKWQLVWNKGYETEMAAKKMLRAEGYDKVYTLTGGEERGHDLTSGYWVVVEANHKIYDGTYQRSFGLGASGSSYEEAEQRAVSNLSQYDWSWDKSDGYEVDKRGVFE